MIEIPHPDSRTDAGCHPEPETLVLLQEAVTGEKGGANNPDGCKGKGSVINSDNVTIDSKQDNHKPERGNSKAYTLQRLKREQPELFERVVAGELSANAADSENSLTRLTYFHPEPAVGSDHCSAATGIETESLQNLQTFGKCIRACFAPTGIETAADSECIRVLEYASIGSVQEPRWRVQTLLMKLKSDISNKTDYFIHKFMNKIKPLFANLPKPKDWNAFTVNDLPLLFTPAEVQQFAIDNKLNTMLCVKPSCFHDGNN